MSSNRSFGSSRRGVDDEEERSHSSQPQTPIRQSSLGMQPSTPSSSSGTTTTTTTTTRTRFERRAAETATKINKLEKAKAGLGLGPPPLVVDPYNHHRRVEVVRPNDEDGARHRNFKERTAERKAARNARPNIPQQPHRQPSTGTLYSLEQKPPSSSSSSITNNNQASGFSNNEQGPLTSNSTPQPGAVAVIYQDRPHTTTTTLAPPPRRHEEDRVNDDDDDAIHNDEQETLVAARVVQEENRALHAYVAEPTAPLQQAAAPIVWPDEVESIDPKQKKGAFVISRRSCWILLIVVILVIATVSTVMGFLLGSNQPNTNNNNNNNNNNTSPPTPPPPPIVPTNIPTETTKITNAPTTSNVFIATSPTASPSSSAEPSLGITANSSRIEGGPKCSFCYQDDASTYNSLQLIFNKVLVPNDEISCLEFREEVNRIEAHDASCPVGQSLTWKHCGCPQLPPYSNRRPPRNTCPICGKSENPTTNTTQCDNEQRFVEMVGTAIPVLCPILANNGGRVCTCPVAPADPPSNRTNATNTIPVDDTIIGNIGNRFGIGNRIVGDGSNLLIDFQFRSGIGQPIGVPMNPAAPSSVAYMVSWAGATNACGGDGVVSPTMNVSCGNGGSLEMLNTTDQQGGMLRCHNTSMSTAICSTDLTGAADRFDASVTFLCTGSNDTQWQGAVQAPALNNIVCNGSVVDHFATHGVSISYYDFQADMIMSNSTCVSDFETSGGVCYSAASCNSSTTTNASNCTTTVPSVGVSQNTPIAMSARFQAVTPGMAPTPAPTPEQTFACPLANQTVYRLELLTDYFPQETGWELRRLEDDTVVAVPASSSLSFALTEYVWRGCVNTTSCYRLTITDSAGDGLCCDYGMGNYTLIYNNETIQTGGEFGFQDVALIGSNCEPYSVPSASPSSSSP